MTVTVEPGVVCVTVSDGFVMITVVAGALSVRVGVDSVVVVTDGAVVTVVVVAGGVGVESVGVVRATVRVTPAALFPPPPHDERRTEASTPRAATALSLAAAHPKDLQERRAISVLLRR